MVIARRPRWRVITFIAAPAQGHGRGFCDDCTLVAHLVRDEGVAGSNPATPTNEINDLADRLAYQTELGARNGARLAKKYLCFRRGLEKVPSAAYIFTSLRSTSGLQINVLC
jgi:hypothetical protein